MAWEEMGVADITVIYWNCPEEKSRNMYNSSYKLQTSVTNSKIAYQQNTLECHENGVFQPLPLQDSVINQCN
jgi:hypothetical protein